MPRFVIDLGDIEMSRDAQDALSDELQKVALSHVARLDFRDSFAVRFPWDWLGLILRRDFESLKITEQQIGKRLAEMPIAVQK